MTIFALSSAPGRAAIAVIRVSGPAAGLAIRTLTGRHLPDARSAALRTLRDPETEAVLDQALVLWLPGPGSETGEDLAEFHVHGGRAVVSGLLDALARLAGLRPAEPGEFTRRAVVNAKLDLTAAEAVADLVDAHSPRQRDQALEQMSGSLADLYDGWRERLIGLMARTEAVIDFADEELPKDVLAQFSEAVGALRDQITDHLADERRGERLREGLQVVILGAPNVGKSSLLNQLARRDAAIVSEEAGTTRDVVEVTLEIAGFAVTLADTAGLRETGGTVELEGIRRARQRAEAADLCLLLVDATRWDETRAAVANHTGDRALLIATKADLAPLPDGDMTVFLSNTTGEGLDGLISAMAAAFEAAWEGASSGPTRQRHRAGLEQTVAALGRALEGQEAALVAEDLRLATVALGRITGRVDIEDVLDVIFREFCIGK
ncbi:MAG: tRNA uridine-5-carboxymethylaminomethyl(34) synthesis GTPase MnmE [Alphaproteobacteria bacterium]|nr:tRNA uridine-5-carboxymethylaminomethyl(34) synthesis GTPase MnmE [Rhodospirillaceae bacterium]MBT6509102.1 tRNA uridine-5-carboxymethylaminomethyl(34) synthesis GTPase MnmE [Rhodospirillaceae bacterium]MDG2482615.1 tRNA uridine-5-carboxymethylaminomethyl(34) synthesis GTPase MnmE [Alphaproteobacteria bacterium]